MKTIRETDYIKANRKASRELEIEMHGKLISMRPARIAKSSKAYSRKDKHSDKKFSKLFSY